MLPLTSPKLAVCEVCMEDAYDHMEFRGHTEKTDLSR